VFESFEILAHGVVFASGDEPKRKGAAFPGKDGGGIENLSETERPENLQNRSQSRKWLSLGIGRSAALQPMSQAGERLAPKGSRQLGAVQVVRPAAEGGGIGHPIGVFQRRRRLFPRAVLHKVPAERLRAGQQAVVGIREREQGKQSEALPATRAKAASDPNPVVMFIVRLLAPTTVTDDGITFANRASPQHDLVAVSSPVGFELVRRGRKWDKENRDS
jgi:hypothetical protein